MKKNYFASLIALFALVSVGLMSFVAGPKSSEVTGRGIAEDGTRFKFNVTLKDGVVEGEYIWAETLYLVECLNITGNTATLTLENGDKVYVVDNGEGSNAAFDQVSGPTASILPCEYEVLPTQGITEGNIQVHK